MSRSRSIWPNGSLFSRMAIGSSTCTSPPAAGCRPRQFYASFRRAAEFFPHYFPDTPPKAYVCWSWIYNPCLAEFFTPAEQSGAQPGRRLSPPSRIRPGDGLEFIFYQDKFDASTAPRKTSLQRAVLDYLASGGRWRCGTMFYLMQDMDQLGTAVYSRRFINTAIPRSG